MNNKINAFIKKIIKVYNPVKIYVFGSAAKSQQDEYSDVDIAVIAGSDLGFIKRLRKSVDLLPKLSGVDLLIYTPDEFNEMVSKNNQFAQEILKGKVVYEKS